jgi:chemotaxis methyl-accepting protein methylase
MFQELAVHVKHIPAVDRFIKTDLFRSFRHRLILQFDRREDRTFTRFIRLPTQYEVLAGPVMDFLETAQTGRPLAIVVLGCSNGAEAFSIASILTQYARGIDFSIKAVDLDREMIRRAWEATYSTSDVFTHSRITPSFVENTFDEQGDHYTVKPELIKRIEFSVADVLDEKTVTALGNADIVFVQNLLVNLRRNKARIAFRNAFRLLKRRSVMFVDGMDHDLRTRLTRRYGLTPLTFKLDQIYREAREERGAGWPYNYWGIEPFLLHPHHWQRRYGTIFVRDDR